MSRDSATDNKWRTRFKKVGWLVGGAGLGLLIGTIPFVTPALRKFCLPYVPATPTQVSRLASIMRGHASQQVIDIGSGDGRVVMAMAREGHKATGVELNLWLVLFSRLKSLVQGSSGRTKFYWKDLWKISLKPYDTIIVFGIEGMMEELGNKVLREAKTGTQVIACRFPFPKWEHENTYESGPNSIWTYRV